MPLPQYHSRIPVDAIDGDRIKRGRWDLHGIETREALLAWLEREKITGRGVQRLDVYTANVEKLPRLRSLGSH